jgi:UDP-glucose 4-epimerase
MTQNILVTGGAGFIGSHTVVALVEAGHQVTIVDDLSRSDQRMLSGIAAIAGADVPFAHANVGDTAALRETFDRSGPFDAVVHLAAYKSVRESVEFPLRYHRNNVGGLVSLLEVMQEHSCRSMVFSSSCTVYGEPEAPPVTETTPMKPAASPYGATKQMCERILEDCLAASALDTVVSLRYFNPAGAHPSARIGEIPFGVPDNLVPYITQTAAGLRPRLQIFGSDYDTPDGTPVRDYLHVMDLAEAHVAAVEKAHKGPKGLHVYNLGVGRGTSVLEVVAAFQAATGIAIPYDLAPRRPGDVERIWSSCEKANRELGWTATRSLEDLLASAWAWQKTLKSPD